MGSTFIILSLPEPHDSQVVYLEDLYSGEYLQRGEQVTAYNRVFDRLRDAALDDEGTQAIINRVLDEWQ
jgi:hypothetical protein